MHPSWYGTLCLGTGTTVPYRVHLRILAGMVHCVLVQVLLCDIGCTCAPSIIEGSLNSKLPTIWRVEKQMKSR